MAKYALIKEGIIVQIQPNKQDGFIEVPEDVVCGMISQDNVFVNPPKTQDQIEDDISIARDEAMLQGFSYNGKQISVTKDDGDGMMQVETSFKRLRVAITNGELPIDYQIKTVIRFKNKTELPMTEEEFETFSLKFLIERGKFFQ